MLSFVIFFFVFLSSQNSLIYYKNTSFTFSKFDLSPFNYYISSFRFINILLKYTNFFYTYINKSIISNILFNSISHYSISLQKYPACIFVLSVDRHIRFSSNTSKTCSVYLLFMTVSFVLFKVSNSISSFSHLSTIFYNSFSILYSLLASSCIYLTYSYIYKMSKSNIFARVNY